MAYLKEMVAAYLARTGSTRAELAGNLGMSRTTLHSKLNGDSEFTLIEGYMLKNILGCSADDLFESSDITEAPELERSSYAACHQAGYAGGSHNA